MAAVLTGFSTVWLVILAGYAVAKAKILTPESQKTLALVSFYLGNPCLLFLLLWQAQVEKLFAVNLLVSILALICAGITYLLLNQLVFHRRLEDAVIGTFLSNYTNAANMGLPIAGYILGDMSWMAPILLVQVIFIQPLGLGILDYQQSLKLGKHPRWWHNILRPIKNPMTLGAILGLTANLTHLQIPEIILKPVELLGQLAVPAMLVAFGISLAHGSKIGQGLHKHQMWTIVILKLIGMPIYAFILAQLFQLDPHSTFAVTLLAGLPSAQNIFVHAVRYDQSIPLARDTIFVNTLGSIPTLMIISLLMYA